MATVLHDGGTPFCLERLEGRIKKINGSTITASEGRRLLVELVGCFVVVGRKVGRIEDSIFTEKKKEDSDLMRSGLKWFGEKVLPTLVSTGIIAALLWFAAVNGHISITP